jgi:hypothetical protein
MRPARGRTGLRPGTRPAHPIADPRVRRLRLRLTTIPGIDFGLDRPNDLDPLSSLPNKIVVVGLQAARFTETCNAYARVPSDEVPHAQCEPVVHTETA